MYKTMHSREVYVLELPTYVAITGMSHYYGSSFLKPGSLYIFLRIQIIDTIRKLSRQRSLQLARSVMLQIVLIRYPKDVEVRGVYMIHLIIRLAESFVL